MPVYTGTPHPAFDPINTVEKDGFAENRINMASHTGTHIDAPAHVISGGKTLDQFPVEKFTGKAMVVPCEDRKEIGLDFLQGFEEKISQVEFVLFRTGWSKKWGTEAYYQNCPTLTREAAEWLAGFDLKAIGFDSFSSDFMDTPGRPGPRTLPNHFIFLPKEILLIESLANLDQLPDEIFMFFCLPLKIENADGSPVRAIAVNY